ncbi:hypothetical protein V6N13_031440 [Hibiscus sabdariffa]
MKRKVLDIFTFLVFLFFDFVDVVLCVTYQLLDQFLEAKPFPCYCGNKEEMKELSETLVGRENVFREMGFLSFAGKLLEFGKKKERGGVINGGLGNRWSDCGCDSCVSWIKESNQRLHVVVTEFPQGNGEDEPRRETSQNVIFLHGFLSSSSFWTQTVFKHLSEPLKQQMYRLIAVDLLGFGKSPKPNESLYTLKDHVEMIEKSVIFPYELSSFHLVAHSMGCTIALALAAKYPMLVKSVTLVAPAYFSDAKDGTRSSMVLNTVARKTLWPPLAFAWHNMHNVICGGSKFMDDYVEILVNAKVKVRVIHGDQDSTTPLQGSTNLKNKFPQVELNIVQNADHSSVILHRKRDFAKTLQHIWAASTYD